MKNSNRLLYVAVVFVTLIGIIAAGCQNADETQSVSLSGTNNHPGLEAQVVQVKREGNKLELVLELKNWLYAGTGVDVDKAICSPYVSTDPITPLHLWNTGYVMKGGDVVVTYEYHSDQAIPDGLSLGVRWVIGPCDDVYNFEEANVTPVPMPLLADFDFEVKVE